MTIATIVHLLVAVGLITTVLLQSGKSAGISGAIGGGAEAIFGKKKGLDEVLGRITTWLAVGFMITSLVLAFLHH